MMIAGFRARRRGLAPGGQHRPEGGDEWRGLNSAAAPFGPQILSAAGWGDPAALSPLREAVSAEAGGGLAVVPQCDADHAEAARLQRP